MWQPREIIFTLNTLETSTGVVRVMTDAGIGYLKALGNPQGPHALVREYVGTMVATFLALRTLECSIISLQPDDEIILGNGDKAQAGPAFITKEVPNAIQGFIDLKRVTNKDAFTGLIVVDTLLLNKDRYPGIMEGNPNYDNLLFSKAENGNNKYELIAMDYSHCMHVAQTLGRTLKKIDYIKDENVYGFFPEFKEFVNRSAFCAIKDRLNSLNEDTVKVILDAVPSEWECNSETKEIIQTFLIDRARFLYDNMERLLAYEKDEKMLL